MSISRWERSVIPPTNFLLKFGMLAQPKDCWFFWGLAGLTSADVLRVLPQSGSIPITIQTVSAGAKPEPKGTALVAIPLLPLVAAATKEKGSGLGNLSTTPPEALLAAPALWCPNPAYTVCLRVKGDSMQPVLHHGYIIAVDQMRKDTSKLDRQIIVAHHRKMGLVVSRYRRINGGGALFPDNRLHPPVSLAKGWRVVGKVLWWIGHAEELTKVKAGHRWRKQSVSRLSSQIPAEFGEPMSKPRPSSLSTDVQLA
jgi:hypothetical protein